MPDFRKYPHYARLFFLVGLFVSCSLEADASVSFLRAWGSQGTGPGQFSRPVAMTSDSSGNVYVADGANHCVHKFTNSGEFLLTWGTSGNQEGQFGVLTGITADNLGYVYTTEAAPGRVQKFTSTGTFVTCWAESRDKPFELSSPIAIAASSAGDLYVISIGNNGLQVYNGWGVFLWGIDPYLPGPETISAPTGVALTTSGDIFVTQQTRETIVHLAPDGTLINTFGHDLGRLDDVATAPNDNIVVFESNSPTIRVFSPVGELLESWGTRGDGDGEFRYPVDVAVDAEGTIYVLDAGQRRVQAFSVTSTPTQPATWSSIKATLGSR